MNLTNKQLLELLSEKLSNDNTDALVFLPVAARFIKETTNKAPKTIAGYNARLNLAKLFLKSIGNENITCQQFDHLKAKKFLTFLLKDHSHNYSLRVIEFSRMVIDFAINEGLLSSNPLYSFKVKKTKLNEPVFLFPDELTKLENYLFASSPLRRAADLFLFQCYTGFDFTDLTSVGPENISKIEGKRYIIKKRNKTGVEAIIPFLPQALQIWTKYNYQLPVMQNQPYNRFLKEIAMLLGINKRLTSHVGRKTFSMLKLNYEGYSIESVSKMSGHASVKVTETYYAKVRLNLISKELDRLGVRTV